jgi:Zn-dependent peptidase ImmA (M78 family)
VLRSDAYYRSLAEQAVADAGFTQPPVAIERVADAIGVPIRRASFPFWFRGALIYEDGMPTILVNDTAEAPVLQATLGHLVGHLLMVLDDPEATYPRDTKLEHREADVIRDELMAPAFLIRDQAAKWFNDYRYLSGLFGVDEAMMLTRMQELGLIKTRGITWDY